MTFVAQPYEQIADDLLTALTGGLMREEYRFEQSTESYSLATSAIKPESLKIVGQNGDSFVIFEKDIDYYYDAENESVEWKEGGKRPDEQTAFYVNYYPAEGRRRLTDRNPGSVTTTLAEAFAREFAVLNRQMELIYKSAFVDLATGPSLAHVAALLGVSRKTAKFASGEIIFFTGGTPAPGDITIPASTLVSTDEGINFETTNKRTLRKGQLSVISPVRAQIEGPAGKLPAGSIRNIHRPIFGIESVMNEKETFFANEEETDEELRQRIKGSLERAGRSTINAIKFGLIEDISEITEANIMVADRPGERGIVEVKLGLVPNDDPDLVRRIEESISRYRPAGVRVVHNLPTRTKSESEEKAEAKKHVVIQGEEDAPKIVKRTKHKPEDILSEGSEEMPGNVVRLAAEIFLRLGEENHSVAQKEDIENAVRDRVMEYVENLPMGDDVIYNKLIGLIVRPSEIVDASLRLFVVFDKEKVEQKLYVNLATDGRKVTIEASSILVGLMEESVLIDILIQVEEKRDQEETEEEKGDQEKGEEEKGDAEDTEIMRKLEKDIADVINEILASANGKIEKRDIKDQIEDLIGNAKLKFAEDDPVVLNAEYEETGLLLNNTDEVAFEEHQVFKLKQLRIEKLGELHA
jgi:hypothetical protein